MSKQLILCDCLGTQTIDRNLISDTCGVECSQVHSNLCGKESAAAAAAITTGEAVIACIQEHALFEELAEDLGVAAPQFVDIRDRAGWSENSSDTGPKMAALIADALRPQPQVRALDVVAEGLCLILGKPEIALRAAVQLSDTLSVTVLLA
ncbi:MAG: (4Fe-4S)-binding protein, partial [Rhodobacteraceae bacterium]|nr:(4Fe-4S)-binding protein [Paracoccaceae bacterium]